MCGVAAPPMHDDPFDLNLPERQIRWVIYTAGRGMLSDGEGWDWKRE